MQAGESISNYFDSLLMEPRTFVNPYNHTLVDES
jgi:hypothetical protein